MISDPEKKTTAPDRVRLDGDALYVWAKMITEIEFAQKALRSFGEQQIGRRGLDPEAYWLDNEGYIHERTKPGDR